MKIFIESINQGIRDSIENGPYIPKFKKNGSFIAKPWSQWTNDECKMAKLDLDVLRQELTKNQYQILNSFGCSTYCQIEPKENGGKAKTLINKTKQQGTESKCWN